MVQSPHQTDTSITGTAHGGQVLSWHIDGMDRLYSSPNSPVAQGRAHRGGIPVIFPQFNTFGPGARHGFARLATWESVQATPTQLVFRLGQSPETLAMWPYEFEAVLAAECRGRSFEITLSVENMGRADVHFTCALHTYIRVDDIARSRLSGLSGTRYLDCLASTRTECIETGDVLDFGSGIDRIYLDAPESLLLDCPMGPMEIRQHGFSDTVVWNPGADLAASMPDLGTGEHTKFICVEAASVRTPVNLSPGQRWQGHQILIV